MDALKISPNMQMMQSPPSTPPVPPNYTVPIPQALQQEKQDRIKKKLSKNSTLDLLKTVTKTNQSILDESLGLLPSPEPANFSHNSASNQNIVHDHQTTKFIATRERLQSGATEYDEWEDDPFYTNVSPYNSDDNSASSLVSEDERLRQENLPEEDLLFFKELDRENEKFAKKMRRKK